MRIQSIEHQAGSVASEDSKHRIAGNVGRIEEMAIRKRIAKLKFANVTEID